MTLGQLKSEWSVSVVTRTAVSKWEHSKDLPLARIILGQCVYLVTVLPSLLIGKGMYVFIFAWISIPSPLRMSSFGLKKKQKWSDGATSNPLLLATSVILQLWGLFSWSLPARGIYSLCHFMPAHKVTPKSVLRSLLPLLEDVSAPQSGTVGGHLSPASVSFPQEDKSVLPWALSSLRRNVTFAQHNFASI